MFLCFLHHILESSLYFMYTSFYVSKKVLTQNKIQFVHKLCSRIYQTAIIGILVTKYIDYLHKIST